METRSICRLVAAIICCAALWPGSLACAQPVYKLGPDSFEQAGAPKGRVEKFEWTSRIFHGTRRDAWVYVPAQYDPNKPACVMIFQDGGGFVDPKRPWRAPTVFDNLIHKHQMPVTIGIFLNPGVIPPSRPDARPRFNRSFEYDSLGDQYARFLLDEILPEVGKKYNLAKNGNSRGLCGISSGGICAFTAAWERPTEFTRVVSFVGSFTDLRGGNVYPDLVRKTEPKPLRVFLQDGKNDLNNFAGNWYLASQEMAAALEFSGYDYQLVVGDEGHNARQGSAIFPDAMRWVWRDDPRPINTPVRPSKQPVMGILIPGEGWQQVGGTYGFTEGPAADREGNVYFTDIPNNKIYRIDADANVTQFADDTGGANGLMFGPDGKLYACQSKRNRVVAYDKNAKAQTVVEGIEQCNDLCIDHAGGIYVSEPPRGQVWYVSPGREKKVVSRGIALPNGVILTPDQSQLIVADTKGVRLLEYQIKKEGSLDHREAFFDAQVLPGQVDDGADGMTMDKEGRLYVATRLGFQVFDPAGQVIGIINKPQNQWLANVVFGGKNLDSLYAACGNHVYRRKTKTQGVLSSEPPIKPKS